MFITLTVVAHRAHDHDIHSVCKIYVVVVVGVTAILELLRFGNIKFNPVIFGVMVASIALVYHALSIAVCHGCIVGVLVVNEQVEIGISVTLTVDWQIAGDVPAAHVTTRVYVVVVVGCTERLVVFRFG